MLGALKVLQSLVERILEPLDGLDILYVHGVWSKKGGGLDRKKEDYLYIHIFLSYTLDDKFIQCNVNILKSRSTAATATRCSAALDSAGCLCKRAILEKGFLLLVVNDAP